MNFFDLKLFLFANLRRAAIEESFTKDVAFFKI